MYIGSQCGGNRGFPPLTILRSVIIFLIKIYQKILSFIPIKVCRFYPSCSEYMAQSIIKNGVIKGFINGTCRIFRCNPFNPGGYDPVR